MNQPQMEWSRLARFFIVGGLNTLFGFLVFSLLALTALPTWLILVLAHIIGIALNFLTTGGIVFKDLAPKRIPRFLIAYAIVFCLYLFFLDWLTPIFGSRIYAMALVVLPVSIFTYFLQAKFVFEPTLAKQSKGP
jgi:putative flippase GtrA